MNLIEAKNIIKEHKHQFYTYVLKRPEGVPFYVGKGGCSRNGYRIEHHEMEAIKGRKGKVSPKKGKKYPKPVEKIKEKRLNYEIY